MKKIHLIKKSLTLLMISTFVLVLTNCTTDTEANSKKNSISKIIQETATLSILNEALLKTDLVSTLDNEGSYTIFAPTNDAFTSFLTANNYSNIDAIATADLKQLLLNHVINTKYTTTTLPIDGYLKSLGKGTASSENTLSMYVNKTIVSSVTTVKLNGVSNITSSNILASNGILHVVDGVIGLPTIVTHVSANSNFSKLVSLLANNPSSGFIATLSGTANAPFTVFAPKNGAFTNAGITDPNLIPASVLETTLKYHIVVGQNRLNSSLINTNVIPTFASQNIIIVESNGVKKIKDANNILSPIVITDIQCKNGVIHTINGVLKPL